MPRRADSHLLLRHASQIGHGNDVVIKAVTLATGPILKVQLIMAYCVDGFEENHVNDATTASS